MNAEQFTDLTLRSQLGDSDAAEQLLLKCYAPVLYLSQKILQEEDTARQVTREVLETIFTKLASLDDPEEFQKWMCRITAARCMQAIPLFRANGPEPSQKWQEELTDGMVLTDIQSAHIIQQMVDALPQSQRLCLLLLGCGGLHTKAIAQLTGLSDATVREYLQKAQETIQRHLWELQARDIQFSGLSSLTGILRLAMFSDGNEEEAIPMVYGILGKEIPVPPDPEKKAMQILTTILVLLALGIMAAGGYLVMRMLG